MSRHATFENFGMAFLTLFQVSTGDNWNGIMKVLTGRLGRENSVWVLRARAGQSAPTLCLPSTPLHRGQEGRDPLPGTGEHGGVPTRPEPALMSTPKCWIVLRSVLRRQGTQLHPGPEGTLGP